MLTAGTGNVMAPGIVGHAEIYQRLFKSLHGETGAMKTLSGASPTSLSPRPCARHCYFLFVQCQLKQRAFLLGLCFPVEKITLGTFQKMLLKRILCKLKTQGKKVNILMAFYYYKNWSENSLNFLPPSVLLSKPLSVGGGLCLNSRSRDGEMALFVGSSTMKVIPVTFPEYLLKLKWCFQSKSFLLVVAGRGYLQIQQENILSL